MIEQHLMDIHSYQEENRKETIARLERENARLQIEKKALQKRVQHLEKVLHDHYHRGA